MGKLPDETNIRSPFVANEVISTAESLEEDFARFVGTYNDIFAQLPNTPAGFSIEPCKFLDIDGYRNPYDVWKFRMAADDTVEETNALAIMFVDPGAIFRDDFGKKANPVSRITWEGFRLMSDAISLSRRNEVLDVAIIDGYSIVVIDFDGCHPPDKKDMRKLLQPPKVVVKIGPISSSEAMDPPIVGTVVGVLARALNRIDKYKHFLN
ncbi:hypothetical protein TRVA0_009S03048 [Trichomonascus vanleenenianus]|uniref:uncharacterized protein n=1 Tax=Trichomonascus vanleenenianus TaxID=2268995 RepID=UPI003EC9B6EF